MNQERYGLTSTRISEDGFQPFVQQILIKSAHEVPGPALAAGVRQRQRSSPYEMYILTGKADDKQGETEQ